MDFCLDVTKRSTEGAPLIWTHPGTGEKWHGPDGRPVGVLLAGSDSDQYRAAQAQVRRRNTEALKARKDRQITDEEAEENLLEVIAACVLNFLPGNTYRGQEYSPEVVLEMFRGDPWTFEQCLNDIGSRARFIEGSKTT